MTGLAAVRLTSMRLAWMIFGITALLITPALAFASGEGGHSDPVGHVALALVIILVVAKLGGDLAVRIGQPAVLGELAGGVLVGNLGLVGVGGFEWLKTDASIDMLSRIGVLILFGLLTIPSGAPLTSG